LKAEGSGRFFEKKRRKKILGLWATGFGRATAHVPQGGF
jgi:hypothetical protein